MMRKIILKLVSIVVLFGIFLPSLSLATKPTFDRKVNWQYYKDINISGSPAKGDLVKITLDQEVFGNAKQDLGDLRVTDGSGGDTPFKLIVEKGTFSQENIYPVKILNSSYSTEDDYNIFIVDFGQDGFLNSSLNILTSSENFKRTVEISGSDDMSSWNVLRANGYIYDYTDRLGSFKAQNTSVNYPENAFRFIQVKIFAGGETPLLITGAQVSKIKRSESREAVFNPKYEVTENSAKKRTWVLIDLGRKGWPTSDITLISPDENFNREVVIYESSDKNSWRKVGESYIFNYNTPKFVGANLEISYSETSERYLRIEIFNGDNKPISITGVSTKTILRSIVFQHGINTAGKSYQLYYGNPKADFPQYDLEKFFPYLDTGKYISSSLSSEKSNSFYQEKITPLPPISERIPYLVPGILVMAILMMGFIVFKFMKKVNTDK
ncbi:MAG: DUF3999 family protein [Patescibacteria group bacterium]|nr:DUF3999 family protein [Patescibacteria group bacterium]